MGVYIRGAKIPSECGKCFIGAREEICGKWYPSCPLVEVKEPHGRLVDIDRVISVIAMNPDMPTSELREACTVIEAEGKESE